MFHSGILFRHRYPILITIVSISIFSILVFNFNITSFVAAATKGVIERWAKVHFQNSTTSSDSNSTLTKKEKLERTEILEGAIVALRGLPRAPFISENLNKNVSYNASCAVRPSILDIQFANIYWQVANTSMGNFFLYGAYYDNRNLTIEELDGPVVRILGMVDRYLEVNETVDYCHLWFEGENKPVISNIVEQRFMWEKGWGKGKYYPYLLACSIPETHQNKIPVSISVVESPCENALNNLGVQFERPDQKKNFAVCVKGLDFLHEDVTIRLVEWLELIGLLGAEKIFFYEYAVSSNVSKILRYYKTSGFIDVTPITLPGYLPNDPRIRHLYLTNFYKRNNRRLMEVIAYNDCLYRNLHNYKYLVLIDTDELIIPSWKNISTWGELIKLVEKDNSENFEKLSAIAFRNVYFLDTWMSEKNENRTWTGFPQIPLYMYHLQHVYRARNYSKPEHGAKCFHNIERVIAIHNHFPRQCFGGKCKWVNVQPSYGQLQHYKPECPKAIKNCSETIGQNPVVDKTIWKYKDLTVQRTENVLTDLGFLN